MPHYFVQIGMGGLFILLGLVAIIFDKREEKNYYNSLSSRRADAREFLEHWPPRPQFGSLKIGGLVAIALGAVMIIMGGAFWLWG